MQSAQASANSRSVLAETSSRSDDVGTDDGGSSGAKSRRCSVVDLVNPPMLLRAEEVAYLLGLGRSKVYELMQSGELPTVRIGTAVRVPTKALTEWVKERSNS